MWNLNWRRLLDILCVPISSEIGRREGREELKRWAESKHFFPQEKKEKVSLSFLSPSLSSALRSYPIWAKYKRRRAAHSTQFWVSPNSSSFLQTLFYFILLCAQTKWLVNLLPPLAGQGSLFSSCETNQSRYSPCFVFFCICLWCLFIKNICGSKTIQVNSLKPLQQAPKFGQWT